MRAWQLSPAVASLLFGASVASAAERPVIEKPKLGPIAVASTTPSSSPYGIRDFMREPQYSFLTLSPDGRHLAAEVPLEDRRVLAIIDRERMAPVRTIDFGRNGEIAQMLWVSPKRVLMTAFKRDVTEERLYRFPAIYGVDVDGTNKSEMNGYIFDALENDDDHVLIADCSGYKKGACETVAYRVNVYGRGTRQQVAKAPDLDASFLADHDGVIRWSVAVEATTDRQRVQYRRDASSPWELINDEQVSGVGILPIQFTADNASTIVQRETKTGTDVVVRMDMATRKLEPILRHARVDPMNFITSADGSDVVGAYFYDGRPEAMFVDPEAPAAKMAAALAQAFPDDDARVTGTSRDGKLALVYLGGDRQPGSYYLYEQNTGKLTPALSQRPWLDPARMARTKPVTVKTRDGLVLNALLTEPTSGKRPFPLIVNPHGGPYGVRDIWEWDGETQLLASRGYAVLKVDYRGSGGYGRAFGERGIRQWGRAMQDDLTDATQWAVDQGITDAKHVCLFGWSYGAYAAFMGAVREPGRYRCVAGAAGVYDLEIFKKWGDVHRTKFGRAYLDRVLGTDAAELAQYSPTRQAARIDAAILIAHGGRDERASPEHYRAMKRALDAAGKRYVDVFHSAEGHGVFDEERRVAFYEALLKFLDANLKQD